MIAYRHNAGGAQTLPFVPHVLQPYHHRVSGAQAVENVSTGQTLDPMLRVVERVISRLGYSAQGFGLDALNDARLVADLRRGRILRPRTRAKISAFILQLEEGGL